MPAPRYATAGPPKPEPRLRLGTYRTLLEEHPGLTEAAIRAMIFRAKENGLAPHLYRKGRRVWIDLDGFQEWIRGGK